MIEHKRFSFLNLIATDFLIGNKIFNLTYQNASDNFYRRACCMSHYV